jgi:hypothetical protein
MINDNDKYETLKKYKDIILAFSHCIENDKIKFFEYFEILFPEGYFKVKRDGAVHDAATGVYSVLKNADINKVENFFSFLSREFRGDDIIKAVIYEMLSIDKSTQNITVSTIIEDDQDEISFDCVDTIDLGNYPIEIEKLSRYILSAHKSEPIINNFKVNLQIEGQ